MVKRTTAAAAASATAAATTTATPIIKKKKGRPSLADLQARALLLQQQNPNNNNRIRSTRRIPNLPAHFLDGPDSDDDHTRSGPSSGPHSGPSDDDERVEKKSKLVVQFPNNNDDTHNNNNNKKHNSLINAVNSQKEHNNNNNNNNVKGSKATDNNRDGTTEILGGLQNGPTTTTAKTSTRTGLPDKKLLLLILDKLQKKDTRNVFAEPVDPEELPDYHDIIEHPMDFETIRKKLSGGVYTILEQLEDDVTLICSNAMQYNAPSTMFFRQARAIQELAKKEFEILRQDGSIIEAPIKPRRGRPPGSRNLKVTESSPPEPIVTVHESSSEATPASREEDLTQSGSYNVRKGSSAYRFPSSLDYCFDYSGFSASSSKVMTFKYGKKTCGSDESRRGTYFLAGESNSTQDLHLLATSGGLEKQLTEQVGLGLDNSYSRSLARFAADLGPDVWKIVSKRMTNVLPPGVEFGPGWAGVPNMSSTLTNYASQNSFESEPQHPMTSGFPGASFASKPLASCSERPPVNVGNDNGLVGTDSSKQIQHPNSVYSPMKGGSGSFASGAQFQEALSRPTPLRSSSLFNNPCALDSLSSFDVSKNFHGTTSSESDLVNQGQGMPYWQNLSIQERWDHPYPAELNRGFQASSSKSSNLPIGSPQLDLVLQL